MIDLGSSLDIILLSIFEVVRVPQNKITVRCIVALDFGGNATYTLGFIILDLIIGPMRPTTRFHLIYAYTTYYMLLRRPRISRHRAIPSSYHQCLKAIWKEK